jgi:hypothetical protein
LGEEMKPAFHHYLLAHTATFSIIVGIVGAIGLLLFVVYKEGALMGEWPVVGWIFLTAIPVAGIGFVVGVAFIWTILGGIAARIQGWPFVEGDEVVILAGKDRGRVTKVYEVWESRGQVRLELGDEAKESLTDVYCAVAITRTNHSEHSDGKPGVGSS